MALFATPVSRLAPYEERIIEFKGLNRKSFVEEGEMSDMSNMCSDDYPALRPARIHWPSDYDSALNGSGELDSDGRILRNAGDRFYIIKYSSDQDEDAGSYAVREDGAQYGYAFFSENLQYIYPLRYFSTAFSEDEYAVRINDKMCFFPSRTYVSIRDITAKGHPVKPEPLGIDYTLDGESEARITITNEHAAFEDWFGGELWKYDDVINLEGTLTYKASGASETTQKACTVSCIIEQIVDDTTLILPRETFIELTGEGATAITYTGSVKRPVPDDLKFVIEHNNRLWGVSGNTIVASKLGDPTNWQYYQGTGLDSFYAERIASKFTASTKYNGRLLFFSEDSITTVYGTGPASFQIDEVQCSGTKNPKSIAIAGGKLFYVSPEGVMAYEGGLPYIVSEKLVPEGQDWSFFDYAVAGSNGSKYFVCLPKTRKRDSAGYYIPDTWTTYVLDVDKALWHIGADACFSSCYSRPGSMLFIPADNGAGNEQYRPGHEYAVGPASSIFRSLSHEGSRDKTEWSVIFGPFTEYIEDHKIYSKLALRCYIPDKAYARVSIAMDDGGWVELATLYTTNDGGTVIPIAPRRCDRFTIKIEGRGDVIIKSLTRKFRKGSGNKKI